MIGDTRHPARTVGASTRWSADEAEQMLALLEGLINDIRDRYGEQIERERHEAECQAAQSVQQQSLDLDEPLF